MSNLPGRILLADSNTLLLNLQRSYFSRQRINVASAQSASETLKMLPALRPQVVILAYELGDSDGAQCCEQIKKHPDFHATPVLLLAPDRQEVIDLCWESGCDGVLVRPVQRRELANVTQHFINLSQRTSPRIDVRALVRFGINSEFNLHDYSVNLSAGGLYLASLEECALGQEVQLEFLLPGTHEQLSCHGRIAWINQGPERRRHDLAEGFGIEFVALDNDKRRFLQQYVMGTLRTGQS